MIFGLGLEGVTSVKWTCLFADVEVEVEGAGAEGRSTREMISLTMTVFMAGWF